MPRPKHWVVALTARPMARRLAGYLIEPEDLEKMWAIASRLQGGSDRERDEGHRLSLILERAGNFAIYKKVPS